MAVARLLLGALLLTSVAACSSLGAADSPGPPDPAKPVQPADATTPPLVDPEMAMAAAPEPEPEPAFDGPRVPIEAGTWRIIAQDIGLEAAIIDTGLEPDGTMEAPAGPAEVGWFRYGSPPGSSGNALMGGHVDWTDRITGRPHGAVFFRLRQLQAGSLVVFTDGAQEFVYEVSEKRRYRWDDPASVEVLQPTTESRLTLITCGGVFNSATRSYDMRDVIIALRVA
ncbi:MAG: class F sortase [Dehalococcoidia bacterium]|nr:class F sortase [Dehalococcoidia bacterium]